MRIVNCARGGLVDEQAVADLIGSGHIAGAAFDVFAVEPAKESPLFGLEEVVVTPHLGASTGEAQENVALQVAEQISRLLEHRCGRERAEHGLGHRRGGSAAAALHAAGRAARLVCGPAHRDRPEGGDRYLCWPCRLAEHAPLTQVVLTGLLRPLLASVNMVNAPALAKQRNIHVKVVTTDAFEGYQTLLTVEVLTESGPRAVSGTLFQDAEPRLVAIRGIPMEARLGAHMLYVRNQDKPGLIGALGRRWATRRSTSRPSISVATGPAATPSPWSRSTGRSPSACWPRSAACRRCCTRGSSASDRHRRARYRVASSAAICWGEIRTSFACSVEFSLRKKILLFSRQSLATL